MQHVHNGSNVQPDRSCTNHEQRILCVGTVLESAFEARVNVHTVSNVGADVQAALGTRSKRNQNNIQFRPDPSFYSLLVSESLFY